MKVPHDGRLSHRDIVRWFDDTIPVDDLSDEVIDGLVEDFFENQAMVLRERSDDHLLNSEDGGNVRIDDLSNRMWGATPLTVARYRCFTMQALRDVHKAVLDPWELHVWETAKAALRKKREDADQKAMKLLASIVRAEAYDSWIKHGWITEPSGLHPGTYYNFRQGHRAGNIEIIDMAEGPGDGDLVAPRAVICAAPAEDYPDADIVITQILHMRAHEATFLQLANLHSGEWSEQELAVRAQRTFHTVPRYDKIFGGYVNVPVDLATFGGPSTPTPRLPGYEAARVIEHQGIKMERDDVLMHAAVDALPDEIVNAARGVIEKRLASLKPDPKLEQLLAAVDVPEEMAQEWEEGWKKEGWSYPPTEEQLLEDARWKAFKELVMMASDDWLEALEHHEHTSEKPTITVEPVMQ